MLSEVIGQHFSVLGDHDLFGALRMSGDDVTELIEDFAERLEVDMTDLL